MLSAELEAAELPPVELYEYDTAQRALAAADAALATLDD